MIKILPMLLAISAGDRYYDHYLEVELQFMYNMAGCVADTGWWTVETVDEIDVGGQCAESVGSASGPAGLEDIDIHIIFFAFPFDQKAYWKGGYVLPLEAQECYELMYQSHRFNQCIDYIHHPETLPRFCI